jgi:protein TonB
MFEQSVVEERAMTARPWTLVVSVVGQMVLITAAVVLPMLHPDMIRRVVALVPVGAPPGQYHPANPDRGVSRVRQGAVHPRPVLCTFPLPRPATHGAAALIDYSLPAFDGISGDTGPGGVEGGIGAPGVGFGAGPGVIDPPPTPPAPRTSPPVVKAAPPAPAPPRQVTTGGDVQASLLIFRPEPVYPPLARQARVSGAVHLTALISTDGRIESLRARDGHPLLVRAAMDAVKQWVYRPTLLNGVPVEVVTEITVTFTLN